jgi:hypothetical protein
MPLVIAIAIVDDIQIIFAIKIAKRDTTKPEKYFVINDTQ